jgi:hypothetical protein
MFYGDIVPLDRDRHRAFSLDTSEKRFGMAADSHVVPALVQEFGAASTHLPILFLPSAGLPVSVFLVGLRSGKSTFVGSDGEWRGEYVPAYLRRYPFMFGEVEGRDPIVCIDAACRPPEGDNGARLFSDEGEDTPLLIERIRLMNEYFDAAKVNEAFIKTINELGLLRPIAIDAKTPSGESLAVHGLLTVDEQKLNALPDDDFLRLRKDGLLGALYAHLCSLANIEKVRKLS